MLTALEAAIFRTVLYGDVFSFAMTVEEIHHFLMHDDAVCLDEVSAALETSAVLRERLHMAQGYVACSRELISLRIERAGLAARMWPRAVQYGRWLARLPFVRMVGVTGALAMNNPSDEGDDLDYLLITAQGRVWLARGLAVMLVRFAKLRGTIICPNFVLAENSLQQTRCDLYVAHEIAQIVPLYGRSIYDSLRRANPWTDAMLPNARHVFHDGRETSIGRIWGGLKRLSEAVLSGRLGDRLEKWEYQRKLRRFARDMQTPHSAAKLDKTQVKGHFKDHGYLVLQQYQERLVQYGLVNEADTLPMAGD